MSQRAQVIEKKRSSAPKVQITKFSLSATTPADHVLSLQRSVGNQAVQKLIQGTGIWLQGSGVRIQAKLRIGQPNDVYEQEADRIAEEVIRMPDSVVQAKPTCPFTNDSSREEEDIEEELIQTKLSAEQITPLVQRQGEPEEEEDWPPVYDVEPNRDVSKLDEEEVPIMTKGLFKSTPRTRNDLPIRLNPSKGDGQQLSKADRNFMERRFGADFSSVRVHTDSNAAQLSRELNAQAFTYGRNIYFSTGRYNPGTSSGKKLLSHELTHVMQQHHTEVGYNVSGLQIQRTSANCPEDWEGIVLADHNRALDMIDVARRKLSQYVISRGVTPREVSLALNRNFGNNTSVDFADWVNTSLFFLRGAARSASYDCEDTDSWWCGSNNVARALWCVPGVAIRVCHPFYFDYSDPSRSEVLIHEWLHKYKCSFDLGYVGTSGYPSSTATAILNADSWSEFVRDVQLII